MAVHKQVDFMLKKAQETIDQANEQLQLARRLEQGDPAKYSEAQLALEEVSEEIDALIRSSTPEQRDRLHRTMQQIRQKMNEMILK